VVATAAELRELDDDELENRLAEHRRELLNLRFQLATGQLDNSSRLPQVRRDLARVLTVLRERDIEVWAADIAAAERAPALREDAARRRAEDAAAREAAEAAAGDEAGVDDTAAAADEAGVDDTATAGDEAGVADAAAAGDKAGVDEEEDE
jgi:large subunit ribosomal protein L29